MIDLAELLRQKQMKRVDLARLMQVDKGTVTRWAQRGIPADRLMEISEKTGIPTKELRPDLAALFSKAKPDHQTVN